VDSGQGYAILVWVSIILIFFGSEHSCCSFLPCMSVIDQTPTNCSIQQTPLLALHYFSIHLNQFIYPQDWSITFIQYFKTFDHCMMLKPKRQPSFDLCLTMHHQCR
jgi:hypothetical protein